MKNFIGRVYDSNFNGKFKILNEVSEINGYRYFEIEFIETGYRMIASYEAIRHGRVKDKLKPSVAGVGYVGSQIKVTDNEYHNLYKSWNDMINRCYNEKDGDYPLYGALGVTVDQSWFSFTIFYNDAIHLSGYQNKLKEPENYQLDKDLTQLHLPKSQRVYSKETCLWIPKSFNIYIMNLDRFHRDDMIFI
jgi:hypothetical protein